MSDFISNGISGLRIGFAELFDNSAPNKKAINRVNRLINRLDKAIKECERNNEKKKA